VNKPNFLFYNADHHATAERVVEAALRGAGRVPRSRDVVNVYGNADAGDMSAGLDRSGPAAANEVGKREAAAMLAAWRQAGGHLSRSPALDLRWTRVCFCGQSIDGGAIDTMAEFGLPYTTGSEENRGPLFDVTHQSFEGLRAPVATGPQGDKLPYKRDTDGTQVPKAIPLVALRLGDQQVVSVPAEMTVELGRRLRAAVMNATAGFGVVRAVIAGYANEYASYLTTPDEYDAQHYEGGTTVYGRLSGPFFVQQSADLAGRLARGLAAPAPFDFDPTRGMKPSSPPYPPGAAAGSITDQPGNVRRLSRVAFGWRGGESGLDRPLDRAFVTVQRRAGRRWVRVDDDLGLNMLWRVTDDQPHSGGNPTFSADAKGTYQALWQVPLGARPGSYRFLVTANRYRLASRRFRVAPSNKLTAKVTRTAPGTAVVQLAYPPVVVNEDLTDRPQFASSGTVRARAGSRTRTVTIRRGRAVVHVPASATVSVPAGAARDRYGNRNGG
jgi:neutral ceramidase